MNTTRRTLLRLLASVPFLGTAAVVAREPKYGRYAQESGTEALFKYLWDNVATDNLPVEQRKIYPVRLNSNTIGG